MGALAYTPPLSREEVPPECALSRAGHPFIRHYVYLLPRGSPSEHIRPSRASQGGEHVRPLLQSPAARRSPRSGISGLTL